jgi:hypothetical protein
MTPDSPEYDRLDPSPADEPTGDSAVGLEPDQAGEDHPAADEHHHPDANPTGLAGPEDVSEADVAPGWETDSAEPDLAESQEPTDDGADFHSEATAEAWTDHQEEQPYDAAHAAPDGDDATGWDAASAEAADAEAATEWEQAGEEAAVEYTDEVKPTEAVDEAPYDAEQAAEGEADPYAEVPTEDVAPTEEHWSGHDGEPAHYESPVAEEHDFSTGTAALAGLAGGAALGSAMSDQATWGAGDSSGGSPETSYVPPPKKVRRDNTKLFLLTYALVMTIVSGILFKRLTDKSVRDEKLESLPDFKQAMKVGQVSVLPPGTVLAPGHSLKIGEKRRFGNIEVEPVKLTRGMVNFTHPIDPQWAPDAEGPVVKLWLRLKNVSKDQTIPPFDKYLVFTRLPSESGYRTNNLISLAGNRKPFGYVLSHETTDKSTLNDQNLEHELAPGEEMTTYIPSTPELDLPKGELLWRVHLRKGFGASGVGVTTLFEVVFSADEVRDEA